MLPSTTKRGESSWTPPRYSAPIWRVLPEAKSARATLASIRRRRNGTSARRAVRPSRRQTAPRCIVCGRRRNTVSLVVTLLAHGCPLQAIVVAFRVDERTVAAWVRRTGVQGEAGPGCLGGQPPDRGRGQGGEVRG